MNLGGNPWEEITSGRYRRWMNVASMNSYIYDITEDLLTIIFQYGTDWKKSKVIQYKIN